MEIISKQTTLFLTLFVFLNLLNYTECCGPNGCGAANKRPLKHVRGVAWNSKLVRSGYIKKKDEHEESCGPKNNCGPPKRKRLQKHVRGVSSNSKLVRSGHRKKKDVITEHEGTDTAHDHATDDTFDIGYTSIVYIDDKPACSATLLSRMWAITTCLCVKDIPNTRIYIRIGDPTIKSRKKYVFYTCGKVEVHPQCITSDNQYCVEHDLAVLRFSEPFLDSKTVNIAKLPHQLTYWTPDSELGLDLASWTDLSGSATSVQKAVWHMNSSILRDSECNKVFKQSFFKPKRSTCASYHHKGGKDSCRLDIGAPLGYDYILIGILAQKKKCGEQHQVASFVNIPMHSEWIRKVTTASLSWVLL